MGTDNQPAIIVDGLRFRYPPRHAGESEVDALRGVSFSVRPGESLSICGPLGSGKTTLCLALAALVPHCTGGAFGGRVVIHGLNTRKHSPGTICRHVGVVLENADAQILGGITEFMNVAALAAAYDLKIAPHGAQEIHVHLVCAVPNGLMLEYYRETVDPLRGRIFRERLEMGKDGRVSVPDRPGLGFEPDYGFLAQYRVG